MCAYARQRVVWPCWAVYASVVLWPGHKQGLASPRCFWYVRVYGEVSEWFNVLVLKTNVAQVTVGSNPTLSEKAFVLETDTKHILRASQRILS